MYLLETGHAPGDPPGRSPLATEPQFEQIEMWSTW